MVRNRSDAERELSGVERLPKRFRPYLRALGPMPSGRRDWFEEFLERTIDAASGKRSSRNTIRAAQEDLGHLLRGISDRGVLPVFLSTIGTALDPDGKEERRGWSYGAQHTLRYFAPDDIREILEHAIRTPDFTEWLKYPAWFGQLNAGDGETQAFWRGRAVKFYPSFSPWGSELGQGQLDLMTRLLDDNAAVVRWTAALAIVDSTRQWSDRKLIDPLIEAVRDRDWVWSFGQHYADFSIGANAAADALGEIGPPALAAVPYILELIEATEHEYRNAEPVLQVFPERRLERLRLAMQRIQHPDAPGGA
jgi:hypothetical protein